MDTVNLKQLSSEIKSVEISGEVYFPGIYPISENQTLSELIKRAGGIKESGSLEASREPDSLMPPARFISSESV